MTTSRKRSCRSLVLALTFLAGAAPVRALPWEKLWWRQEWVGYEATTGYFGFPIGDFAIYGARHGLGVGTTALRFRVAGWDVPRRDGNDVSGHLLTTYLPVNVYATLHSWEGRKTIFWGKGKRSIGRIEAYGSYCPWGRLSVLTRERRDILGGRERVPVGGYAKAEVLDVGLRLDLGTMASFSVGRLEFKTADTGLFRPKRFEKVYGGMDFYFDFGVTEGREAGGGIRFLAQDAWYWLSKPFRSRGVTEKY